jgi:signal transduction histidine kinase
VAIGVRSALQLCLAGGTAILSLLIPPLLIAAGATVAVGGLGLVLLPLALAGVRRWADLERARIGRVLGTPVPARARPLPKGVGARLRAAFTDLMTLRELAWVFTHVLLGVPGLALGLVSLAAIPGAVAEAALWWAFPPDAPLSTLGVPMTDWGTALAGSAAQTALGAVLLLGVAPPAAAAQARLARVLLSPSRADLLAERVETLTETRVGALDAHAAELRRIERDLHDGTQARLVALAMRLGLAERVVGTDPEAAARLLREAQGGAEEAMTELRDVIRTIYPPILADRGLAGAAASLAARSAVPVRVDVGDLGAVPAAVESTAYFVVSEALANAARHASATRVVVRVWREGAVLRVRVVDDGVGGAREADGAAAGTGIAGMRRRVAALDGALHVTSPVGGPTGVEVELPCGS